MSATAETRELTPALIRGRRGSVSLVQAGELAPDLEGQLLHHVFAEGAGRRESTLVLTSVPEGIAFAPALVCRDRRELGGGAPAQLPAERWQGTELESTVFNRRFRLLTLKGQDPIFVRELFSPSLISWLAHDVPEGFSFELNERHLAVALPGHLESEEELERLRSLAAEVRGGSARRRSRRAPAAPSSTSPSGGRRSRRRSARPTSSDRRPASPRRWTATAPPLAGGRRFCSAASSGRRSRWR